MSEDTATDGIMDLLYEVAADAAVTAAVRDDAAALVAEAERRGAQAERERIRSAFAGHPGWVRVGRGTFDDVIEMGAVREVLRDPS